MKKTTLIFIILTGLFIGAQAQEYNWEYVNTLTGEQMLHVYAQGEDTVYVVGGNGLIAKSTDKGLTWEKQHFTNGVTLNDIVFCNNELGFIVGNNGTILRTQNAGVSWEQMNSGTAQNLKAIAAFDLNNVWAIGDEWDKSYGSNNQGIIQSTDMGDTWSVKYLIPDEIYNYVDVYAAFGGLSDIECKDNKGCITGYAVSGGTIILKTEDRGVNWRWHFGNGDRGISSLCFTNSRLYGLDLPSGIVFTDDFTNDYAAWNSVIGTGSDYDESCVFIDDQIGYELVWGSWCYDRVQIRIFKTLNVGKNWDEELRICQNTNYSRSNFSFSSNKIFGYVARGTDIFRTPYTGEFNISETDITKSENSTLILQQHENELLISSDSKMIDKVVFFSVDGVEIMQKTVQSNSVEIDVYNLPAGVYLINAQFADKTTETVKWVNNNKIR